MEDVKRVPPGTLSHLERAAGYTMDDISHSEQKPCTHGGVIVRYDECIELFNLLEANPHPWNRILRVTLAGWILHLIKEGKIEGHLEVTDRLRSTPGR